MAGWPKWLFWSGLGSAGAAGLGWLHSRVFQLAGCLIQVTSARAACHCSTWSLSLRVSNPSGQQDKDGTLSGVEGWGEEGEMNGVGAERPGGRRGGSMW